MVKKAGKVIGKVSHYFDKIGVAALVTSGPLVVGDTVKFSGHDKEFTQTIASMQIDRVAVEKAKKGDDVAVKVDQEVKEGDEVATV